MSQHYSNPARESDPHALPDLEVFYVGMQDYKDGACPACMSMVESAEMYGNASDEHCGWYYWFCLPGCLPDGEPEGPFETEAEALADAREGLED